MIRGIILNFVIGMQANSGFTALETLTGGGSAGQNRSRTGGGEYPNVCKISLIRENRSAILKSENFWRGCSDLQLPAYARGNPGSGATPPSVRPIVAGDLFHGERTFFRERGQGQVGFQCRNLSGLGVLIRDECRDFRLQARTVFQ